MKGSFKLNNLMKKLFKRKKLASGKTESYKFDRFI